MGLFEKKKKDAERCPICGKEISFFSGLNIEEYYGRENWKISTSDILQKTCRTKTS